MSMIQVILVSLSILTTPALSTETQSVREAIWIPTLQALVEINSSTANLEGIAKVREKFKDQLEDAGLKVRELKSDVDPTRYVLEATTGAHDEAKVAFIGHIDTVFPSDTTFKTLESTETSLKGPGVIDMKGGLVLMLEVLKELKKTAPNQWAKIKILINEDEETGSKSSSRILDEHVKGLSTAIVFEPGTPSGEFVHSQSGVLWADLKIKGRAAHAGLSHKLGKNACVELARVISTVSRRTNYKKNFTVNAGVIKGGTTANTVCENASVSFDVRFVDSKDADRWLAELRKKAASLPAGFTGTVDVSVQIPSLGKEKTTARLAELKAIGKRLNIPVKSSHVGYIADSNHIAQVPGLTVIVGAGPYGSGIHTSDETMDLKSFDERKALLVKWLEEATF
jgi:glutamate carboxypeptidase